MAAPPALFQGLHAGPCIGGSQPTWGGGFREDCKIVLLLLLVRDKSWVEAKSSPCPCRDTEHGIGPKRLSTIVSLVLQQSLLHWLDDCQVVGAPSNLGSGLGWSWLVESSAALGSLRAFRPHRQSCLHLGVLVLQQLVSNGARNACMHVLL